jgi:glycosyltransferase involved in cell wall biosynthesis
MDKITFCIPSKDNLRYLKTCIPSIRKNAFRDDHDIIVFVDQDNDGTVDWLKEVNEKYNLRYLINPKLNKERFGIGRAYDECIRAARTDIVMVFHADMMLGKNADKLAFDHLKSKTAVSCTRVEPPLHPNNGEKIIRNFGIWPEEFVDEGFDKFVEENKDVTKTTNGIFAPWMVYKQEFLDIGGHDPILKSCREDSDVFNRMQLEGFNFIQPWNSLVYHLTGRGAGSFSGDKERHDEWQKEMQNSTKEFIRKWGTGVQHDALMKPIVTPFYNKGLVIKNATMELLELLEPYVTNVYTDKYLKEYLEKEGSNTEYTLGWRLREFNEVPNNDIILFINGDNFTQADFNIYAQLSRVFEEQKPQPGTFKLGNINIKVNKYEEKIYNRVYA